MKINLSPGFVPYREPDLVARVGPPKLPVHVPLDPINFTAINQRVSVALEHAHKPVER